MLRTSLPQPDGPYLGGISSVDTLRIPNVDPISELRSAGNFRRYLAAVYKPACN